MSPDPAIVLFDIPSTVEARPWNPNTWKARIVLNYKRIPYKTVWVPYPEIESTLKKLGATPHVRDPDGEPHYMLPALLDMSGPGPVVVTDSLRIAEYLDAKYPERPVIPREGKALQYAFEQMFNSVVGPCLWKMTLPLAWDILDKQSQAHLTKTRERWRRNVHCRTSSSSSLSGSGSGSGSGSARAVAVAGPGAGPGRRELAPEVVRVTEDDWRSLKQGFDALAAFLDKNSPGQTYVAGGSVPTRADMILVSYLASIVVAAPEKWDTEVRKWSGGRWERLWAISEPWRVVH